jgi:SAM-dependent methyltransferase
MPQTTQSPYVPALGFDWLTPAYDLLVRASTRERAFKAALIEQANLAAGQQVLDLACGTGTLAIWIKQRYPEVNIVGIDGDPKILSIAARKARQANVSIRLDRGLSFEFDAAAQAAGFCVPGAAGARPAAPRSTTRGLHRRRLPPASRVPAQCPSARLPPAWAHRRHPT